MRCWFQPTALRVMRSDPHGDGCERFSSADGDDKSLSDWRAARVSFCATIRVHRNKPLSSARDTRATQAGHATASASVHIAPSSKPPVIMSAAAAAPYRLARASPAREANAATAARRLQPGARASPAHLMLRGSGARAWSRVPAVSRRAPARRRGLAPRAATASDGPFPYPIKDRTAKTLTLTIGDSEVTIETGRIGLQANGAVVVTEGETVMYATICAGARGHRGWGFRAAHGELPRAVQRGGQDRGGLPAATAGCARTKPSGASWTVPLRSQ